MVRSTELGGRVFKKSLELARAKKDFARRDSELSSGADKLKEISENVATALTESDDMFGRDRDETQRRVRTLRAALKSLKRDGAGLLREAKNRAAVLAAKNRQYLGTTHDRLYRKYEEQVYAERAKANDLAKRTLESAAAARAKIFADLSAGRLAAQRGAEAAGFRAQSAGQDAVTGDNSRARRTAALLAGVTRAIDSEERATEANDEQLSFELGRLKTNMATDPLRRAESRLAAQTRMLENGQQVVAALFNAVLGRTQAVQGDAFRAMAAAVQEAGRLTRADGAAARAELRQVGSEFDSVEEGLNLDQLRREETA